MAAAAGGRRRQAAAAGGGDRRRRQAALEPVAAESNRQLGDYTSIPRGQTKAHNKEVHKKSFKSLS